MYLGLPYIIQHPYLVLLLGSFLQHLNQLLITLHKQSFVSPKSVQKLIRQAACVNMQLQGCSQTHIQPDLGAPLPLNAIFLRRVVSTQGGTQDLWTVGA